MTGGTWGATGADTVEGADFDNSGKTAWTSGGAGGPGWEIDLAGSYWKWGSGLPKLNWE
jgi:hypothetical protein